MPVIAHYNERIADFVFAPLPFFHLSSYTLFVSSFSSTIHTIPTIALGSGILTHVQLHIYTHTSVYTLHIPYYKYIYVQYCALVCRYTLQIVQQHHSAKLTLCFPLLSRLFSSLSSSLYSYTITDPHRVLLLRHHLLS